MGPGDAAMRTWTRLSSNAQQMGDVARAEGKVSKGGEKAGLSGARRRDGTGILGHNKRRHQWAD